MPLCLIAGGILLRNFRERVERQAHVIDYLGAALVTVATTLIMLGLLQGGEAWAWNSATSIAVLGSGAIVLVAFVLIERKVAEPVLPLWVFTRRDLLTTSLASFGVGTVMIGFTSYVPTFTQVSLGTGALIAGFSVATMTVGWPVAASNSGRLYLRFGFRFTSVVGSLIAIIGVALMLLLDVSSSPWEVAAFYLVVGLGLGLIGPSSQIAAQQTVGWSERGVVTSANMFARSVGSAIGVAIYGAIVNGSLGGDPGDPDPGPLADAVHAVFVGVLIAALLMLASAAAMPRHFGPPEETMDPADEYQDVELL